MKTNIYSITFIILLFISCTQEKNKPETRVISSPDRTILVYMGGKNNLSIETYEKLEALREGWKPNTNGYLVVYHAPLNEAPQLLEICSDENGENIIKTIETYDKENSAHPEVLRRVINKVISSYPAESYGMIVFSHATGWLPGTDNGEATRAIIVDNYQEMELMDFAAAIPNNQFEFIILEACHMAGIEVAYQLKDKTEHILASSAEILSPGFRDIYREDISYLYNIHPDLEKFAENGFSYFSSKSGENRSATFSIIHTAPLSNLAKFLKTNLNEKNDLAIETIQHFDRYPSYRLFYDFKDYFIQMMEDSRKQELLSNLINECVIYKNATTHFMPYSNGFEINKHSGLTTYILQDEFPYLNERYKDLTWYKDVFE